MAQVDEWEVKYLKEQNTLFELNQSLIKEISLWEDYKSVDERTKIEGLMEISKEKDWEI